MDIDLDENMDGDDIEIIELQEEPADWVHISDDADEPDVDDESDFTSDAHTTFSKHSNSVTTCDVNSDGQLAVSGGEDDRAYVWNTSDGTVKFECSGHSDTVIFASFSHDGKWIATADMNGSVKAWSVASGNLEWNSEASEIVWARWHKSSNVLLAGTVDGALWLWAVPSSNCKIFPSYGHETDAGMFLADGKRAVVGYADGTVKLWDLKTEKSLHHFKGGDAHGTLVSSIDSHQDNVLVVTGSHDGSAKLINTSSCKVVATFACEVPNEDKSNGVESVTFAPQEQSCAIGTLSGYLSIWDLPTYTKKFNCDSQAGVVKAIWHPTSPLVFSCCLDGLVRLWDTRSGKLEKQWSLHRKGILDMAISKDGACFVTSSDDFTSCLTKV